MNRKDYIAIAHTLREARVALDGPMGRYILNRLEAAWIELFAKDNPLFDSTKFKEASQP